MKTEIELTKTELKLQLFLILSLLLSFGVIGIGVYFQNKQIDKDYLLVPILLFFWFIHFGIVVFDGLKNGNLIKRWTPFYIYDSIFWLVTKINTDMEKTEKITKQIIALFASVFYLIIVAGFLKSMNS
ncbi:hypothetical protein [Flavobacterium sp.]|uniref:hypothetical protein n=1 Tax=Flavobacterium sp. TaxID=239 RepID=UPI0025F42229|nr:hypothetical protein [Flavobacterium sp.]